MDVRTGRGSLLKYDLKYKQDNKDRVDPSIDQFPKPLALCSKLDTAEEPLQAPIGDQTPASSSTSLDIIEEYIVMKDLVIMMDHLGPSPDKLAEVAMLRTQESISDAHFA